MQLRNRLGDLRAFRPLGAQRKLESRTLLTLSNSVLLMWVLKASWLCCAFDSGWLGTPSSALLSPSVRPTIPSGCRCWVWFFFFLVNFSPSRSPNPSPQAGLREEGKRSTKSAPSTDPQLPWPAAGLQACRRSTQVNFGVSYLHLEKGLT